MHAMREQRYRARRKKVTHRSARICATTAKVEQTSLRAYAVARR
jgi:hypothetical protein